MASNRARKVVGNTLSHTVLTILSIIWVIPLLWILMESFNTVQSPSLQTFFPTNYTLQNYVQLWTNRKVMDFPGMFGRTFIIAVFVCLISTFLVLSVAFAMSRLRFGFRRVYLNLALIIGMFPSIMAVVAIYFILKAMGLTQSNTSLVIALIIVYSAGAGAGFYVTKGYMDTIPMSLDEAAYLDGCTRWQVFIKIILPICRPMIVYQAITAFLAPWLDFILVSAVSGVSGFTVSQGLYTMATGIDYQNMWFAKFAAGAVCVSVPIAVLFIVMQRFYTESLGGAVKG